MFSMYHLLSWLVLMHTLILFFLLSLSLSLFHLPKHANAKNKNQTKTGTTPRRNLVWSSPISSAEHFLPSSKRTNARPKKCRSLSLNSWAWNLPLSVTSSWMLEGGVSRNGKMTWALGDLPQPPALVPKHDRRAESKLGTTQLMCIERNGFFNGALHWWFESTALLDSNTNLQHRALDLI